MTKRIRHARFRVLAFILAFVLLAVALDRRMRPLVREYAVNRAKTLSGEALSVAINDVLSEDGCSYEQLIHVARSAGGAVLSVESNVAAINRLNAAVIESLNATLADDDFCTLRLPVFNAMGSTFLMGRGPRIPLCIQQNGAATTQLNSAFSSAGINQTLHRLDLTVTFRSVVLVAGMSEPIETTGTFLVAETVIVGAVPEVFANINI